MGIEVAFKNKRTRETRNAYNILLEKLEGNRPLGRIRCRWEHNIKIDLKN
jgi:hypothetical protein